MKTWLKNIRGSHFYSLKYSILRSQSSVNTTGKLVPIGKVTLCSCFGSSEHPVFFAWYFGLLAHKFSYEWNYFINFFFLFVQVIEIWKGNLRKCCFFIVILNFLFTFRFCTQPIKSLRHFLGFNPENRSQQNMQHCGQHEWLLSPCESFFY